MKKYLSAGLLASVCYAAPLKAATVIDQQSIPESGQIAQSSGLALQINHQDTLYQTFTVGTTGTLARLDLGVFRSGLTPAPVTFSLMRGAEILAQSALDPASAIRFVFGVEGGDITTYGDAQRIELLSNNISVQTGEQLTIKLSAPSSSYQYWWFSADGNAFTYEGGSGYSVRNGVTTPRGDFAFRSYVENGVQVGAVPEPHAWALMLVGFGALGVAIRRKRAAAVSYAL